MRGLILGINRIFLFIGGIILIIMTLQIGLMSIARSLFGVAFDGNVEIAKYYHMVALSVLGLGAVQSAREHVIVEVFTQSLSATKIKKLDWAALLVTTIYSGILLYAAVLAAIDAFKEKEFYRLFAFDLIIWPSRWVLMIGIFGFFITALYMVFSRVEKID